jgi:hypothetical protein
MHRYLKKTVIITLSIVAILGIILLLLARKDKPEVIEYGISFSTMYAGELGLDPEEVFTAFIDDLGARDFRLVAYWPQTEPEKDVYDFTSLDWQLDKVAAVDGEVILSIGKRLPRWPECHIPNWVADETWETQKEEIREYITAVVSRYRDEEVITHWQVENEPYLGVFARDHCAPLDEAFLEEEIALVKSLDPTRPVLVTDSGNLGTWRGAYKNGDSFGTSVYVYFWNPELGQFRTVIPPWYYRVKENIVQLFYGEKETFLIELSAEPWLVEPVVDVSIDVQYSRMDLDKFNEILEYAKKTRYERQFLWGGEWWYWLNKQGHTDMWERGREVFSE